MAIPIVFKTGDPVQIAYRGASIDGVVELASSNGKSLMLRFDGLLGGFAGRMPVLFDEASDAFRDLIVTAFVELARAEVKPVPGVDDSTPYNELIKAAMDVKTQEHADALFARILAANRGAGLVEEEALRVSRETLGYTAGYYDNLTRERVERLFRCVHPVFGSIAEKGPPSPELAFRLGQEMGERWRAEKG